MLPCLPRFPFSPEESFFTFFEFDAGVLLDELLDVVVITVDLVDHDMRQLVGNARVAL